MTSAYDVVVVGGRVAGASTALLLARAGVHVALLERSRLGSDTVSTHGLMRAGVLQLSRWGLLDDVIRAGTPPVRRTVFSYADGDRVQVSIQPKAGVDALYAPRRNLLDRLLVEAAADAGVDVWHGATVSSLIDGPGRRVGGVSTRSARGAEVTLNATTTVGADGIRSTVAQHVGAPVLTAGRTASAVLYRYVHDLPAAGYEWAYGVGAAAGLIPTNDAATCVFAATTPARMRRLRRSGSAESAFSTLLAAAAPAFVDRVRAAESASPLRGWAGLPGHVRQAWGPGWALVGDAGYFKDPITAHGMTDALRDAELLADQLIDVLGGRVPEALGLAGYQQTRDRLSAHLVAATEEVAAYDWDAHRARALVRRVSSAMSDEVDHLQSLPARPASRLSPAVVPDRTERHRYDGAVPKG
ncbi:NAD(P)/FAD-dependent oxidoreductase [Cellulomonas sp. McL0617]|uniref:NAD(P)/FAD-dependent oxidoreductase n=1 Tax=Cellulomonas sp. McL0617 TaxID=3415675 RepID=UPI003CF13FB4